MFTPCYSHPFFPSLSMQGWHECIVSGHLWKPSWCRQIVGGWIQYVGKSQESCKQLITLNLANTDSLACLDCVWVFSKYCICILPTFAHTHLNVLQKQGKTMFHMAAEENSRECMKLLVYHFKVDPDEPDVVSCMMYSITCIPCPYTCMIVCMDQPCCVLVFHSRLAELPSIMLWLMRKQTWPPSWWPTSTQTLRPKML